MNATTKSHSEVNTPSPITTANVNLEFELSLGDTLTQLTVPGLALANHANGKIRLLPTTWGGNGKQYELVKREGLVVLVAARYGVTVTSYEVAVIKIGPPDTRFTGPSDWGLVETYPSNAEWGKRAWTWQHRDSAENHFDFLCKHGLEGDYFSSSDYFGVRRKGAQRKREYEAFWLRLGEESHRRGIELKATTSECWTEYQQLLQSGCRKNEAFNRLRIWKGGLA
jgi:hypothetical protein